MEGNINPFVRLKIYVINGNSELVMKGLDKIIITFNKREISNYSQFIEKLNEIYNDYGIVDKITDKEGFQIIEFNNLHINNIWNYISNNDTVYVSLMDKNKKSMQNVSSSDNKSKNSNISIFNNKNDHIKNVLKKNISSSSSNSSNKKKIYPSSSSSSSLSNSSNKKNISKQIINLDSSSSSSSSYDSSSSSSSSLPKSNHEKKSSSSSYIKVSKSSLQNKESNKDNSKENNQNQIILKNKNIMNKKLYNNLNKKNYEENDRLLGQKRKNKNHPKNKYSSFQSKKRKNNSNNNNEHSKIKLNYELIPREKLDDIDFLQKTYPKLFNQGTNIKFKIQELLENGIGVGDYHYGTVDNFNLENKSFLIKNCDSMNEKTRMFMYHYDEDLMCVELKNCVEIWIESENIQENGEEDKNYKVELNEELKKDFIKRQIEYYFSDSNYQKDSFLKSKEDENGYIPISVIMSFNKIKMITKDKDLFINVLKENEKGDSLEENNNNKLYELNEDLTKIRKVKLSDDDSI